MVWCGSQPSPFGQTGSNLKLRSSHRRGLLAATSELDLCLVWDHATAHRRPPAIDVGIGKVWRFRYFFIKDTHSSLPPGRPGKVVFARLIRDSETPTQVRRGDWTPPPIEGHPLPFSTQASGFNNFLARTLLRRHVRRFRYQTPLKTSTPCDHLYLVNLPRR